MLKGRQSIAIALSLLLAASAVGDEKAAPAKSDFENMSALVNCGDYVQAKKLVEDWASSKEPNRAEMCKAIAVLSQKGLHESAIILLRRLDWQPDRDVWAIETLRHMKSKGMVGELDKVLTNGTALANQGANVPEDPLYGYRTAIHPQAARLLFAFYDDKEGKESLWLRYDAEIAKRPKDASLLSECAYWLAQSGQVEKAVSLANAIDLDSLELLALFDLGRMWMPTSSEDKRLVEFSIRPLEKALERKISDNDANRYTSAWQTPAPGGSKRELRRNILESLGDCCAFTGQNAKAKEAYETCLSLTGKGSINLQRKYAEVLKSMGLDDPALAELKKKAEVSGKGSDWAELAAYLQGQRELAAAKEAWKKAIDLTPPVKKGFKIEDKRGGYVHQYIRMLDENKMYDDEIEALKKRLSEAEESYLRKLLLNDIATVYVKAGRKADGIAFLKERLDAEFSLDTVDLIIRSDNGTAILRGYSLGEWNEVEKLPTWKEMLDKINSLPEAERSKTLANFYYHYAFYEKYADIAEAWPEKEFAPRDMEKMADSALRCKRYSLAEKWLKESLRHAGESGFPAPGSSNYVMAMRHLSEAAAQAGDLDTSVEYAKALCLLAPDDFSFAQTLAKAALAQGRQDKLLEDLNALAKANPNRWAIWIALANVYGELGQEDLKAACLKKATDLK